jgi:magnesium chelatase accessory protein
LWEDEKATWPHSQASRFVAAAGIRWHVQQMGEGPVLLLVHGTGASAHSWRDVMPILARHYSVIAPDLPGHGFTGPASGPASSIAGMSESMTAMLFALGVQPSYCVGHSAGAVVLCKMALDQRIAPRVIIGVNGAFLPLRGAAGLLFSPIARLLTHATFVPRLIARRSNPADVARLLGGTGSRLDARGVELYARLVRNPAHLAGAITMMGNWDLYAFERELPRLPVPLELIVADHDLTIPPQQALDVKRRLPNTVIHRLAGLGHLAHEENPTVVADLLLEICQRHQAPQAARA